MAGGRNRTADTRIFSAMFSLGRIAVERFLNDHVLSSANKKISLALLKSRRWSRTDLRKRRIPSLGRFPRAPFGRDAAMISSEIPLTTVSTGKRRVRELADPDRCANCKGECYSYVPPFWPKQGDRNPDKQPNKETDKCHSARCAPSCLIRFRDPTRKRTLFLDRLVIKPRIDEKEIYPWY
jgi:hypothetical protein